MSYLDDVEIVVDKARSLEGTNISKGMYDVVGRLAEKFDLPIRPYLIFPDDWEGRVLGPDDDGGPTFMALIYQLDDDRFISEDETIIQVDLYGDGMDNTLDMGVRLGKLLVWDLHGSSYHFFEGGMFEDCVVRGRPAGLPADSDRVSLVTTRYTVTIRR